MNRTVKGLTKRFIWAAMLFFFVGCDILKDNKKELQSTQEVSEKIDYENDEVISFYEVYRVSDEKVVRILESIPEIDGFVPIYGLDYQNYHQNVVGFTDQEEKKQGILSKLTEMDSMPENSFFCWSKEDNGTSNEGFYFLYLLKNVEEEAKIENDEIQKAEVLFNEYINEPEIRIKFNESGTEKWSKMTQKAAWDNNNFIAIVIDFEVYDCPSVRTPIYSGNASISGFNNKNEAEKIVERIEAMKNKKLIEEIESMHSYPEFPDDVLSIFKQIINEYNFNIKSKETTSVVLENKYLELCFSMDRYDLLSVIWQKNIRPVRDFQITQIILHLNPQWVETEEFKSFDHHGYGESAINTLSWYEKYTSKYLASVLNGDFSWSDELFRKDNYYIEYIDFIYKNFDEENEIRKLYEDGDGNWMPKLFKYLEENIIKIK